MINELIYCSKTDNFDEEILADIFKQSVFRNYKQNINGFLFVVNKKSFVQVLQGPSNKINHLFKKICLDTRHRDIELISYKRIPERTLDFWNIRVLVDSKNNSEVFDLWKYFLDKDGYISSILVDDNIVHDTIKNDKKTFDNFENCLYDFKLVTDVFNVIDDRNYLDLLDALNQYNTLYDYVFKMKKSMRGITFLTEAKTNLEQLVNKIKNEKSRY